MKTRINTGKQNSNFLFIHDKKLGESWIDESENVMMALEIFNMGTCEWDEEMGAWGRGTYMIINKGGCGIIGNKTMSILDQHFFKFLYQINLLVKQNAIQNSQTKYFRVINTQNKAIL